LGISAGTVVPRMPETSHAPNLGPSLVPSPFNTTLDPENGKNTGRHSLK